MMKTGLGCCLWAFGGVRFTISSANV